jgi:hypothetical protein
VYIALLGEYNAFIYISGAYSVEILPTQPTIAATMPKGGRPVGSSNLHSKYPSSIAQRLKAAGVDWVVDLAAAIKADNLTRINMWMRMLPYLIVTQGHRKIKRGKGKASKAALAALAELENE